MVRELGHVRDQFESSFGNFRIATTHKKQRCGISNVNKFIGNIAKNYMETTEGKNWASDLINHLNTQFPTSIEPPKNFVQPEVWDVNHDQIVTYGLTSSHSSLPDLLTLPDFPNCNSLQPPENCTNVEYNCYNPASDNIYNSGYFGGYAFNQNVVSTTISCSGMNVTSPLGVKQIDLERSTSPEQASSITECSSGDVISDTETFASRAALPGSVSHSISCPSAENPVRQQPFHKDPYGSSIGKKRTAYNMDFPSSNTDDVQSPNPNSCSSLQNTEKRHGTSHIVHSKCDTQRSHVGDSLQSGLQIPGSEHLNQQAPQPSVQFDDHLEAQSNLFSDNNESCCKETTVVGAYKMSRVNSEKPLQAQQRVSLERSCHLSLDQILGSYIVYKSMPEDLKSQISFQHYMHEEECINHLCNCPLYLHLSSHFDDCNDLDCIICGPARRSSGAGNFHLESRKRKNNLSETPHHENGTLVDTPAPKCLKMHSSVTVGNGFSQEFSVSLNQEGRPDQLPHLEQRPEVIALKNTELLNTTKDPMINSTTTEDAMGNDQRKNLNDVCAEQDSTGLKGSSDITNDEVEKCQEWRDTRIHLSSEGRISDEKEKISQADPKCAGAIIEANCGFNTAPDVFESGLDSMKSVMPSMSLADRNSVLESENTKVPIASLGDNPTGLESEKIKIQSVFLADFFTADQIKEHLSSFPLQKVVSGITTQAVGQNTCHLCNKDKLVFAPAPIYCSSCTTRIKRNVRYYWSADEVGIRHCFCMSCYRGSHGTHIAVQGLSFPKANLQKAKNDEEREDSWVLCDKCQCWQHRICGLYNDERDAEGKAEYICPKCYLEEIESGKRVPLPQTAALGAKELTRTNLSDHIEQRLAKRLKQEREEMAKISGVEPDEVSGAKNLVVRVLVSVDKKLEVKQKFIDILHGEDYPREFSYNSKIIFLFQEIEGVDVCLFGMCVQEFGSECRGPNHRCVYISYLDSVKFFRPDRKSVTGESLRTFVYHEILIGYLEYCKKRGFATCYIWACPLIRGEDYIFYCHPESQKTPKQDKLRQWYKSMLKKATEDYVVGDHTNLYNQFFVPTGQRNNKITAARLPYFDGDYWSGAAENIVRKLEKEESPGGLQSKLPTKRMLKAMGQDNPDVAVKDVLVMQKLGQTILPVKENFMIVCLHHICTNCHQVILSGSKWCCHHCKKIQLCLRCFCSDRYLSGSRMHTCHTGEINQLSEIVVDDVTLDTKDKDDVIVNSFFETRDAFLNKCQKSIFQFDTLAHAKYSSMMILYHLIHKPAIGPTCTICHKDVLVEQCWHCDVCSKLYVCESCYETKGGDCHTHKLNQSRTSMSKSLRLQGQKPMTWKVVTDVLIHASQCQCIPCSYEECRTIRRLFHHTSTCSVRFRGGCRFCQRVWTMLKNHSRDCEDSNCKIPRCMDIKKYREMLTARAADSQNTTKNQQEEPRVAVDS